MYALNTASLLAAKAKGFFILRHVLMDHTTPKRVEAIVNKVNDLYESNLDDKRHAYTPTFTFSELPEGKVRLNVIKPDTSVDTGALMATLDLIKVEDHEEDGEVLCIDPEMHDKLQEWDLVNLTMAEIRLRVRALEMMFEPPYSEMIRHHMADLNAFVGCHCAEFHFSLRTTKKGVRITTFRNGVEACLFTINL
jgi:hypothetical protein